LGQCRGRICGISLGKPGPVDVVAVVKGEFKHERKRIYQDE
jgi:hypothetical protein